MKMDRAYVLGSCQTKTAEGQAIRRCIFFINQRFSGMIH
jgi:hypothetical protein